MHIGDKIFFGDYEWRVLDIQENMALLITENIMETRSYHDAYVDMTWAECSLRENLNGEFYNSFRAADRARIVPVVHVNPDNEWYGTKGGKDTQDYIFLLSIEEAVCSYFVDSSSLLYSP